MSETSAIFQSKWEVAFIGICTMMVGGGVAGTAFAMDTWWRMIPLLVAGLPILVIGMAILWRAVR